MIDQIVGWAIILGVFAYLGFCIARQLWRERNLP